MFLYRQFRFFGRRRRGGIAVAEYRLIRGLSVFGKRPRHFQYAVFFSNLHCIGVNRGIVGPAVFARVLFDDAVGVNAGLCIADFTEARFASAGNGYGLSPVYRASGIGALFIAVMINRNGTFGAFSPLMVFTTSTLSAATGGT